MFVSLDRVAVLLLVAELSTAVNPGLKARISQHGIQYAAEEATEVLKREVLSLAIPDQSGSSHEYIGKVQYQLTNIRVTSFVPPKTTITTAPFKWSLVGTAASIHADWHYWYKKAFIHISDHGSVDGSLSVDMATTIVMGVDNTGRPTIRTDSCNSAVTSTHIKFHGETSWLYNLLDGILENSIRRHLSRQLCSSIERVINVKAGQSLSLMPLELDLHGMVVLDYSLVSPPAFTTTYIEALFKGEFFWKTDKQECPFHPDSIPAVTPETKMLSFWLSKYSINSLGYAQYKHNALTYQLTRDDLPLKSQGLLDTTCKSLFLPCIGGLISEVGKMYPNASIAVDMSVTEAPVMDIDPTGITGRWKGLVSFSAAIQNTTQRFLFSCNAMVTFNLTVGMNGPNITTTITESAFIMTLKKSTIGDINVDNLNLVMEMVIKDFVIPNLNTLGKEGMRLPALKDVNYHSPKLTMMQNSLFIGVDLEYVG